MSLPYFREYFPRKLFFFEFNLMYCDLWTQYIQVRKLFKGGNYLRKYGIYILFFFQFDKMSNVTGSAGLALLPTFGYHNSDKVDLENSTSFVSPTTH